VKTLSTEEINQIAFLYKKLGKYYKVEKQCYGSPYKPGIYFKSNRVFRRVRWKPKDIENYQDISFTQFILMIKEGVIYG